MSEIEKLIDPVLIEKALSGFKGPEEADLFIKALEEYVGIGKSKIEDDLRSIDYIEKPVDMYTFLKEPYYLGIIDTIYPKLVDDLIEFFDPGNEYFLGLFGGSIGWGKCLTGDSLVWTDEGPIRIDKIHRERLSVNVYGIDDRNRLVRTKPIASKCNGARSVFRLVLTSGCELRATAEHPILTGDGWKKLNELRADDLVATARKLPLVSRAVKDGDLVENLVKFLAYMTAEGATGIYSSGKGQSLSCRFVNGNEKILNEFEQVCMALSSQKVTCVRHNAGSTTLEPKGMRGVLRECGLAGKTAKTKRIPEIVWKFGGDKVALFLNRLIACDGNVYVRKPPKIEICVSSEGLADDVMMALKVLGVHGRKVSRVVRNQYKGKQFKAWRVSVTGAVELQKFFDAVGPIFSKENDDFIESLRTVRGNSNVNVVPIGYDRLKELRKAVGGISRQVWSKIRFPKGQLLGRAKWQHVLELLGDRVPDRFLRFGSTDIFWDMVKSLEYAGEEEVYDLDVPETRSFVANGVIVHNSTFSEIAIARIIYEVSCLKNPQKTYRMVKEDKLFFAGVSVTHTQAKRVIFEGLKGKIKGSEYFRTVFPYQDFATELRFPNNVLVAACTQSQVIGMNTFAAAMDEANFMPIVERSQTARLRGGKKLYDQAEVVFTALLRRMETRYLRFGNLPGKLMALSSAQYPDDFMERKAALYQGNKNVFVRNYAIWDTKPEDTYSKERFIIFFNRESGLGRMPKDDEKLGEEEEKVEVPIEFRHDFEIDMEGCLTGDTKIALLDGTDVEIRDLVGREEFWVYSYAPDGRLFPGRGHSARLTREGSRIIEVELDNGELVRCTPDHRFMLRDGTYAEASDLVAGESLMPFYRWRDGHGYEMIRTNVGRKRIHTHKIIAREIYRRGNKLLPTEVVHHANFIKTDNIPTNLAIMGHDDHVALHRDRLHLTIHRPEAKVKSAERRRIMAQEDPEYRSILIKNLEKARNVYAGTEKNKLTGRKSGMLYGFGRDVITESQREAQRANGKKNILRLNLSDRNPCFKKENKDALIARRRLIDPSIFQRAGMMGRHSRWHSGPLGNCDICNGRVVPRYRQVSPCGTRSMAGTLGCHVRWKHSGNLDDCSVCQSRNNHKVIAIRDAGLADVYDISVETYLNFALTSGVVVHNSLRDLAGKATVAIEPFITKRDMIAKMYEDNRRHPFSAYETTLRDGAYVLRDVLCQWVKEEDELGALKFEGLRPKVNPKTRRYVHIDPAISGDAAGFCMGHPSHYEERTRWRTIQVIEPGTLEPKTRREAFVEMLPVIYVDLWLRIVPPPAGEIILGDIRQLIFELKEMGFRFALITMDSFQSKDTQQQLKDKGMNVEELSVDVNPQPYSRLKMALYEARLKGYLHPFGVNELRQLEWNKRKGKVDHRPSGNKDMSDSLAGVVYNCETKRVVEPVAPSLGITESAADDEIKRRLEETRWLLGK